VTHYETRPERPPPKHDGTAPVVIIMLMILGCALLIRCSESKAQVRTLIVPGSIALTIINPPQPVSCGVRGWSVFYTATGTAYRAQSMRYQVTTPLVLELTPALEQCVFVDGFEA
jgi:hypothetical protein